MYIPYEFKNNKKGDFELSIILDTPLRAIEITKSKHGEPKTSSILLISVAITMTIILLMYAGIAYTEASMKQYSACRDRIIGYEHRGTYTSAEEFKSALSLCDSK